MLFKDIPGNKKIKKELISSVYNKRISHAQLFVGGEGSAKLALAISYAQFLNCENRGQMDSCDICASCLKYKKLAHPDLFFVFPVLKTTIKTPVSDNFIFEFRKFIKNNYYTSLDEWIDSFGKQNKTGQKGKIYKDEADNIHKKIRLKNYEAKYRVILIWMPEKMETRTSNKLLKLLEEPPVGTIFILVSENTDKLLATILSRVQIVKVHDFTEADILSYFSDEKLELDMVRQLKNLTKSNLGRISQLINQEASNVDLFEQYSAWVRQCYKLDIQEISKTTDEISRKGRNFQKLFLSYAIKMIRECLIYNFSDKDFLKTTKKEESFLVNFSPFIHEKNSVLIVERLEESIQSINRNANAKILFFELSLQMIKLLKVKRKFAVK